MTIRPRPLVIAHRGASADFPENTLAAFSGAAEQRSDWVELDVHLTEDRALVVHHDPRYPDGRSVFSTPADERPCGVPLLETALDACRGTGVNIEIKNLPHWEAAEAGAVVQLLSIRSEDHVMVSSFDETTLERVRDLAPDLARAQLTLDLNADPAAIERAAEAGAVALHPWDPFVDEELVQRCVRLGLRVNPWTVNDPARMLELAQIGVHGIITDLPGFAVTTLESGGFSPPVATDWARRPSGLRGDTST